MSMLHDDKMKAHGRATRTRRKMRFIWCRDRWVRSYASNTEGHSQLHDKRVMVVPVVQRCPTPSEAGWVLRDRREHCFAAVLEGGMSGPCYV